MCTINGMTFHAPPCTLCKWAGEWALCMAQQPNAKRPAAEGHLS
jgi:hypothetical protein